MTETKLNAIADDAATVNFYSDRVAATIISETPREITVRTDKAKLLNGPESGEPDAMTCTPGGFAGHFSGVQRYEYFSDPVGGEYTFTKRRSGRWVKKGDPDDRGSTTLTIGRRVHYHDFNF